MKTIKLWDGIKVTTEDETTVVKSAPELWKLFNWDIENDPNAKECAQIITRELFCYGCFDLTAMNHGNLLYLKVIPATDNE